MHTKLLLLTTLSGVIFFSHAQPNASCATNSTPCPTPPWPIQWGLPQSCMVNPNGPSPFLPLPNHPWSLVSLDWNVGSSVWNASGPAVADVEGTSRANCKAIKAMHPSTKCFIYHNLELSLQALISERSAMFPGEPNYNPEYFLRYPNGTIYDEPGGPGSQFFYNHTNPATRAFFVAAVMGSLAYDEVDGSYLDDVEGLPSEHEKMVQALNLSAAQIAEHQYATSLTGAALIEAAVAAGKYIWQAFDGDDAVGRDAAGAGPTPSTCLPWMRTRCTPEYQTHPVLQQAVPNGAVYTQAQINASLASFLVTRPPHAFWGHGWDGKPNDQVDWLDEFLWDVGMPLGECTEATTGVFERPWSYGMARLDCNAFVGSVPTK